GQVLEDVYRQVKNGTSLSDAFSSHPDVFPRVYTASILAGEKSGTLENVVRRYIQYSKIVLGIRTKVISSIIYPVLLLCLSIAVIGILVGYVIPKFSDFYQGFAGELPLITKLLVSLALFVRGNAFWIVPSIIITVILLRVYVQNSQSAKVALDRWKLKVPLLGDLWTKFSTSQLMRTLHTLLAGGIPVVNAIEIAASAVGNLLISQE